MDVKTLEEVHFFSVRQEEQKNNEEEHGAKRGVRGLYKLGQRVLTESPHRTSPHNEWLEEAKLKVGWSCHYPWACSMVQVSNLSGHGPTPSFLLGLEGTLPNHGSQTTIWGACQVEHP